MKKILSYLFPVAVLLGMASCEDEKYLFGEGPDERLSAQLTGYEDALCSAPCGWLVAVGSQDRGSAGGAYRFWMKFTPNNRVVMMGDIDATTASTPGESSFRLKAMQYPTLMFDTYNYIHWPADPKVVIAGGTVGSGLTSDYDVQLFGEITPEREFRATGRKHDCPFLFTPATPEDTLAIVGKKALTAIQDTVEKLWRAIKYPTVDLGDFRVQMSIGKRLSAFSYMDAEGEIQSITVPTYAELNRDIRLLEPFDYNGVVFDRIVWNNDHYEIATNEVYDFRKPFYELEFGVGKMYKTLTVEKAALNTAGGNSMVKPFLDVYDAMYNTVAAGGYYVRSFAISFELDAQSREQMRLIVLFPPAAGTPVYQAQALFKVNREADGSIYFTDFTLPPDTYGSNMSFSGMGPKIADNLLKHLLHSGTATVGGTTIPPSGNKFKIDWAPNNTPGLAGFLGGFYLVSDPDNYMPGILGN